MRQVQFRGKRVDNREWVYGSLVYLEDADVKKWENDSIGIRDHTVREHLCKILVPQKLVKSIGTQQGRGGEPRRWKRDFVGYHVIPETVGQYTGINYKNGEKIFCGDLAKVPDDWEGYGWMAGEIREVIFHCGGFRLKAKDSKSHGHYIEDNNILEKIGTIHDKEE